MFKIENIFKIEIKLDTCDECSIKLYTQTCRMNTKVRVPSDDDAIRLQAGTIDSHFGRIASMSFDGHRVRTLGDVATGELDRNLVGTFGFRHIRHRIREVFVVIEAHVGRFGHAAGRHHLHVDGAFAGGERFDREVGRCTDNWANRFDAGTVSANSARESDGLECVGSVVMVDRLSAS